MQILLDSAIINEVRQAAAWGWITSATTNPSLLAQSELPPAMTLKEMCKILPGLIFYQLTGKDLQAMQSEADMAFDILGKKLVLKIPATTLGFQATALLSRKYPVAVTSVYTAVQGMIAHNVGALYIAYYHNRAKRLLPDGQGQHLGADLVKVLEGTNTQVLAASLKTPEEVVEARLAGVPLLSIKFDLLATLPQHELSEQALKEFQAGGKGLLE